MCWNKYYLVVAFTLLSFCVKAQLLERIVTVRADRYTVQQVLELISNEGNFFFSYNSALVPRDSLVDYAGGRHTVNAALAQIFTGEFEFRESGNYIIIRRRPLQVSLVTSQQPGNDGVYLVSGYVRDDQTGEQLPDASVYEKDRLQSTLTNTDGYFRLKLRSKYKTAALTVSKEFYQDTTVRLQPGLDQQLTVTLQPADFYGSQVIIGPGRSYPPDSLFIAVPQPDSSSILYLYKKLDSIRVQRTAMGRFVLSSRLRMQSLNFGKFFTVRPVQASVLPGLSTNGRMNAQVVNHFSLNLFGGYSAGVKGAEIGGLFNIDRKDVAHVQVGGLFNLVGGNTSGFQAAGIVNSVQGNTRGMQVGGVANFNRLGFRGLTVSGVANTNMRSLDGLQVAGVSNFVRDTIRGVQVSGVVNYARRLEGVQVGLVNIADSSSGLSIGLINIVWKGYHKLALYGTELTPYNAAVKTGNHRLYSILMGGVQPDTSRRIVSFGYGIGTEKRLGKTIGIGAELSSQYCYTGSWQYTNLWNRASLHLRIQVFKFLAIYGGPAYNAFYSDQAVATRPGWKFPVAPGGNTHAFNNQWTGWIGWTAGIHVF